MLGAWFSEEVWGEIFLKSPLQSLHLSKRVMTQGLAHGTGLIELFKQVNRKKTCQEEGFQESREAAHGCSCLQVNLEHRGIEGKAGVRKWGRGTPII